MDTTPIVFDDLAPVEVPVTLGARQFILYSVDEAASIKYENARLRGAVLGRDGTVTIKEDGLNELRSVLVAACLREVIENGDGKKTRAVDQGEVLAMPPLVVGKLFERAKQISRIDEEEMTVALCEKQIAQLQELRQRIIDRETRLKNSPGATPATSG